MNTYIQRYIPNKLFFIIITYKQTNIKNVGKNEWTNE